MKICYIAVIDRVVKYFFYPQIDVACTENNEITCITNFLDAQFKEDLDKRMQTINITISRNVNPFNLVYNILKLTKIFKKEKFDVIQYTGPSTSLICSIAGSLARVKTRLYCLWGVRYEGFKGVKRKIFKFLEKISCRFATNVIFDSEYNKKFLINEKVVHADKTHVVLKGSACGIDIIDVFNIKNKSLYNEEIRKKYDIPNDAFVIGYLGRITYEKGINELLFAMKRILIEDENVYLLLVGLMEDEKKLNSELLSWARKEKRVIFTGRQDQPQKFYASFNLFVFPSYREGFGGGVLQAGAFAVPSIVSDIGPLVETIKKEELGRSFPVKDEQVLLETIRLVYKDQKLLEEIGTNMLEYIQQYFESKRWLREYIQYMYDIHSKNKNVK